MITGDLDSSVDKGEPVGILDRGRVPDLRAVRLRLGRGPQHLEAGCGRAHGSFARPKARSSWWTRRPRRKEAPAVYERFRAAATRSHRPRRPLVGHRVPHREVPVVSDRGEVLGVVPRSTRQGRRIRVVHDRRSLGAAPSREHRDRRRDPRRRRRGDAPTLAVPRADRLGAHRERERPVGRRSDRAGSSSMGEPCGRTSAPTSSGCGRSMSRRCSRAVAIRSTGGSTLEVVDDMGYANGRFTLDGGPDGATCTKARASTRRHALRVGARRGVARRHVAVDARSRRSGRRAQGRCGDAGRRLVRLDVGCPGATPGSDRRLRSLA